VDHALESQHREQTSKERDAADQAQDSDTKQELLLVRSFGGHLQVDVVDRSIDQALDGSVVWLRAIIACLLECLVLLERIEAGESTDDERKPDRLKAKERHRRKESTTTTRPHNHERARWMDDAVRRGRRGERKRRKRSNKRLLPTVIQSWALLSTLIRLCRHASATSSRSSSLPHRSISFPLSRAHRSLARSLSLPPTSI